MEKPVPGRTAEAYEDRDPPPVEPVRAGGLPPAVAGNAGTPFADGQAWPVVMRLVTALPLVAEVRRLDGHRILVGECGHASRSAKAFVPTFGGKEPPPVVNIMEYTYEQWRAGKLKLKPGVIEERVTYHDPCNIARKGWIVEQPRVLH